ncbi:snoRNA-binding rRNA-processing protein [Spiromyces aspiralis]|uniref:SnoRNA-binding rRNA-processing protein n=1 Tax=Spiromyces aspiralis TaxID=68401 RepID=A0ACC1HX65_9FUNG|nr:snoRNA-binding rRNA-processing protein [Spiromyces aspiralis]
MGKAKKAERGEQRHNPLYVDLEQPDNIAAPKRSRQKYSQREQRRLEKGNETIVDPATSRRILEVAREQQEELIQEYEDEDAAKYPEFPDQDARINAVESDEDDEDALSEGGFDHNYAEEMEEWEIDEDDAEVLEKFMPEAPKGRQNLADIIMAKIEQHNNAKQRQQPGSTDAADRPIPSGLDQKLVLSFTKIGHVLSRYRSGPLPKIFKILPTFSNWKEVLYLTRPENWTPHATYQATRLFVSNMKPAQAQRFLNLIVLDHVRNDIAENKKLNYHLYMALKKSLYKPAAFFKGILFPLCESGTCTLREAVIIGSVLSKVSVPALHSAAALSYLAQMDYTGPTSLFIRILLDKKYALPYKVVDALVFHFIRFKTYETRLPVLWHQSFLVFVQRYKADLTPEQKEALMSVIRVQSHPSITEEIRRELVNSTCRGEMLMEQDVQMVAV